MRVLISKQIIHYFLCISRYVTFWQHLHEKRLGFAVHWPYNTARHQYDSDEKNFQKMIPSNIFKT